MANGVVSPRIVNLCDFPPVCSKTGGKYSYASSSSSSPYNIDVFHLKIKNSSDSTTTLKLTHLCRPERAGQLTSTAMTHRIWTADKYHSHPGTPTHPPHRHLLLIVRLPLCELLLPFPLWKLIYSFELMPQALITDLMDHIKVYD